VRRGALPARFGRVALQQLAPCLVEEGGALALVVGGARHPIPERDPAWRPLAPPDLGTARARTVRPDAPAPR
jgi:hypothetical protein